MANPLSADALARIQEAAAQISVSHDLDSDIQSELRSHMEDKLLGYLSGEEKPSEADALLLTSAHFGNPATIKSLFQHAHPHAYHVSLARRLLAALIGTLVISFTVQNVFGLLCRFLFSPAGPGSGPAAGIFTAPSLAVPEYFSVAFAMEGIISTIILWRAFAWWRRDLAQGRCCWFQTWPLPVLLLLLPAVSAIQIGCSFFSLFYFPTGHWTWGWTLRSIVPYLYLTLQALLWLWWCDQAPYTRRALLYTAAFWIGVVGAIHFMIGFPSGFLFYRSDVLSMLQQWRGLAAILLIGRGLPALIVLAAYLLYRRYRVTLRASRT